MTWADRIRQQEPSQPEGLWEDFQRVFGPDANTSIVESVRKAVVDGDRSSDCAAYAQLQVLKNRVARGSQAIAGLERQLADRLTAAPGSASCR